MNGFGSARDYGLMDFNLLIDRCIKDLKPPKGALKWFSCVSRSNGIDWQDRVTKVVNRMEGYLVLHEVGIFREIYGTQKSYKQTAVKIDKFVDLIKRLDHSTEQSPLDVVNRLNAIALCACEDFSLTD